MKIPTKPGWYWFKGTEGQWEIVRLNDYLFGNDQNWKTTWTGEWGPRIKPPGKGE